MRDDEGLRNLWWWFLFCRPSWLMAFSGTEWKAPEIKSSLSHPLTQAFKGAVLNSGKRLLIF